MASDDAKKCPHCNADRLPLMERLWRAREQRKNTDVARRIAHHLGVDVSGRDPWFGDHTD